MDDEEEMRRLRQNSKYQRVYSERAPEDANDTAADDEPAVADTDDLCMVVCVTDAAA